MTYPRYTFKGRARSVIMELIQTESDGTYILQNIYNKDLIYEVRHPKEELKRIR